MAVFVLLTRAAKRHVMQDRDIIFDDGGLADDQHGRMIEENAATDFRRRIDIAPEDRSCAALKVEREVLAAFSIEPVREAMRLNGVEALVVQHGLYKASGRETPIDGADNVGTEEFAKHRLVVERIAIGLADHIGRYVGVIQPLADAEGQRGLKGYVLA